MSQSSSPTFFFYDYETWGQNARLDRPVQFAGIRTDPDLNPIGAPVLLYCQPTHDTHISPISTNVHGHSPQKAFAQGIREAEFAERVHQELRTPNTCSVAYNGMTFDHEMTRHLLYRNLRDPYGWFWKNGNSYWDPIHMLRAASLLVPHALPKWVQDTDGKPSFGLEDLAEANLDAEERKPAHDALGDIQNMIALCRKVKANAPAFWEFALSRKEKGHIQALANEKRHPFFLASWSVGAEEQYGSFVSSMGIKKNDRLYGIDLFHDPTPRLFSCQDT